MSQVPKPNQSSMSLPINGESDDLLESCGEIMKREIRALLFESSRGKLSKASATDLVSYYKLLSELRTEKIKELGVMSDEELRKFTE